MTRIPFSQRVSTILTCFVASLAATSGHSEEPAREFLLGLRTRGYYDTAIDYLDSIAASGQAPQDLLQVVDLEKAITLIAGSRAESDSAAREGLLDTAQGLLRQFLSKNATHSQANSARTQLGNLIAERARLRVEAAKRGRPTEALAEARKLYGDAGKVFAEHQVKVRRELEKIPKVLDSEYSDQAKLAERRTQLRADFLQTELVLAAILEETADTFADDSPDRSRVLVEAAQKYNGIYERYRTRLAGLYARLYQGRVNQKLGKYRDALGYYVELLDQPDSPEQFRVLKTKTLRLAVDCWLQSSENKYLEAIRRCGDWVKRAGPQDERDPDWLYLRLSLARAHLRQASEAATNRRNSRIAVASRNEAEKQAKIVAKYESPFRAEAQQMIADLGGVVATDREDVVRNFAQARKAAKKLLDALQPARQRVAELEQRRKAAANDTEKVQLLEQIEAAQTELSTSQRKALEAFRLALRIADRETPPADVNLVRYMLAYLYYTQREYYDAALLGNFVALHYPDGSTARKCAELSLASYLQLYNQSSAEDKEFEVAQVVSAGERILQRWSDYPEGEQAAATLIPFMINAGKLDQAQQYLTHIPDQSPRKSAAAMKTGMAIWRSHLEGKRNAATGRDERIAAAHSTLKAGIEALAKDAPPNATTATAVLCLAQTHVAMGQPAAAIELLLDSQRGPLTLVRKGDPATEGKGFQEDTYRTALQAYLGSLSTPGDSRSVIAETQKLMGEMSAVFDSGPQGQKQLVGVYVGIARELEEQLKVADPAAKAAISRGFETLLDRLSENAAELSVLNWVAETYASLGAGFDTEGDLGATAAQYYERAATTLQNLLDRVDLEPTLRAQIEFRMATVRRKQRKFDLSVDILRRLLSKTNKALNLQIEAATTLQLWAATGQAAQRGSLYQQAMQGDPRSRDGSQVVWGWGRIANVTANRPQFLDSFHSARINLTRCRIGLAQTKQGAERIKLLKTAEKDVSLTKRLFGLGNEHHQAEYDTIMKLIQRNRGEQPIGLQAFERKVSG